MALQKSRFLNRTLFISNIFLIQFSPLFQNNRLFFCNARYQMVEDKEFT